jgi:hypothetical protein
MDLKGNVNKIAASVINAFVNFGVAVYVVGDLLFNDMTATSTATPTAAPVLDSGKPGKPGNILRNRRPM